jgi:hypothetical protein
MMPSRVRWLRTTILMALLPAGETNRAGTAYDLRL